jgi:hypothetical protein
MGYFVCSHKLNWQEAGASPSYAPRAAFMELGTRRMRHTDDGDAVVDFSVGVTIASGGAQ